MIFGAARGVRREGRIRYTLRSSVTHNRIEWMTLRFVQPCDSSYIWRTVEEVIERALRLIKRYTIKVQPFFTIC